MIQTVVKDALFLAQPSIDATPLDAQVIIDLRDTLAANRERCVGMAANMIGVLKNIIIVSAGPLDIIMVNPKITHQSQPYQVAESCLSHTGSKSTTRYQKIKVSYLDAQFKKHTGEYEGFLAQVIQHEIDHLQGILI